MNLRDNMPNLFNFTFNWVIVSSGFPISFEKFIISCSKFVSSTRTVDKVKNQPEFDVSLQSPRFMIHLLIVFSTEKVLIENLKTYGLMDPAHFLENVLLDILKNVMPTVPFSVTTNAVRVMSL